LLDKRGYCLW
jgi:hypothetical protein